MTGAIIILIIVAVAAVIIALYVSAENERLRDREQYLIDCYKRAKAREEAAIDLLKTERVQKHCTATPPTAKHPRPTPPVEYLQNIN